MLREVQVPEVTGRLFLSRMPGRLGPFAEESQKINAHGIDVVVSLASLGEITRKAPEYAKAVRDNVLPWEREEFPIEDFGVPADAEEFVAFVEEVAEGLRAGQHVLIHCGAGIGRTGTLATCVLMALRIEHQDAMNRVGQAGSRPENESQKRFVEYIGELLREAER